MEMLNIVKKFSIRITLDRTESCPVIQYSDLGTGIPMSKLQKNKHLVNEIKIDYLQNMRMDQLMQVAVDLGIESQKSQLTFILKHLYDLFIDKDVEILEVNPLVLTMD